MSQFVQKNKTFIVVLSVTGVAALALIYFDLSTRFAVQKSVDAINENNEVLEQIFKQRNPNPVDGSTKMVQEDTALYKEKAQSLQRVFGKPYRIAYLEFLSNLESATMLPPAKDEKESADVENVVISVDENEINAKLKALYKAATGSKRGAAQAEFKDAEQQALFQQLRDYILEAPKAIKNKEDKEAYTKKAAVKFDRAYRIFVQQVQSDTVEPLDATAARQIFMQAVGLPRMMTSFEAKAYIDAMNERFLKAYLIPAHSEALNTLDRVKSMTYDTRGSKPAPDLVIPIMRRFQIMEDFFGRLKKAKISSLTEINQLNIFSGDPLNNSQYLKFTFQIRVESSLSQIRQLLNELNSAYVDNRVYNVTYVSLAKLNQNEGGGKGFSGSSTSGAGGASAMMSRLRGTNPAADGDVALPGRPSGASSSTRDGAGNYRIGDGRGETPVNQIPDYGMTQIGLSEMTVATIIFDYIIFIGDEATQKR